MDQHTLKCAAVAATKAGVRGALVEGCTYRVANGLVYAAEGMLFDVGDPMGFSPICRSFSRSPSGRSSWHSVRFFILS